MWDDPIVAEVRAVREAYAAKHNYDLHAICLAAQEKERSSDRPVVSRPPRAVTTTVANAPEATAH